MTGFVAKAWTHFLQPLLQRPNRFQVAALCYRNRGEKTPEVLLITSRDTGRWILPKGWPIDGSSAAEAAAKEAWEEAGVVPRKVGPEALGIFEYNKRLNGGAEVTCEVKVFPIEVERLASSFPDKSERRRKWVPPQKAASMVSEPGLQTILATLGSPQ